jgi:hypothetical protein
MKRIPFKKGSHLKKFIETDGEIAFHKKHYHNHLKIAKNREKAKGIIANKLSKSSDNMVAKAKKLGLI